MTANPQDQQQDQGKRDQVAAAAAWLSAQGLDLTTPLAPLLPGIITDGWLIGAASAQAMTSGQDVQTGGWQPGRTDAAAEQLDAAGLGSQLATAQASASQTAQDVAHGYLVSLGRSLVEGSAAGMTASAIGVSLLAALADVTHAAAAALGQIVTAAGLASMAVYRQERVEYGRWIGVDDAATCPACLMNQAAGRVPIGSPYPSGDFSPPIHPHDRCALVPG